jgi:hypothetical protein
MFGWTCTLVITFPVGIVATMREWLVLWGIVDSSHFPVDLETLEWQEKVTLCLFRMCFSSLEEHAGSQVQHRGDYPQCWLCFRCVSVFTSESCLVAALDIPPPIGVFGIHAGAIFDLRKSYG